MNLTNQVPTTIIWRKAKVAKAQRRVYIVTWSMPRTVPRQLQTAVRATGAQKRAEDEGDSGMSDLGDAETNSKLSRSNNSTNTTNTASNSISTNVDGLGQATANATLSFTAPSDPGLSPAGLSLASTQGYAWKEVSVAAVILIVSAWYL
jgi:hypothetical protein